MNKIKNVRPFELAGAACSIILIIGLIIYLFNEFAEQGFTNDLLPLLIRISVLVFGYLMLSLGLFKERINNKIIIGTGVLALVNLYTMCKSISDTIRIIEYGYNLGIGDVFYFLFDLCYCASFIFMLILVVVNTKDSFKNSRANVNRLVLLPFCLGLVAFILNIIFWNLVDGFEHKSFIQILIQCNILWMLLDAFIVLGTSLWVVNKANNQNIFDYASCKTNVDIVQVNSFEKTTNSNVVIADEIKKYKELLDMGAITQEEFEAKKKELLNL